MNSLETKTVRDLAVEIPGATRVFEKLGIDYCCGGMRSLTDACAAAGIPRDEVMTSLQTVIASSEKSTEPDFQKATLEMLIEHIVSKHHKFTRQEIERLKALLEKVCSVHGANHPELFKIQSLFLDLAAELETHLAKEEQVLFPYVVRIEAAATQNAPLFQPPFGTVANPVRMMMLEHDRAGEILKEIRSLSSNYTSPSDGCISYQTLYAALNELEKDLHQHIHLENNILFPRAVEMEALTS